MPNGRRQKIKSEQDPIQSYIREVSVCHNPDEICRISLAFIKEHYPGVPFALLFHTADEIPIRLIEDNGLNLNQEIFQMTDFSLSINAPFEYLDFYIDIIGRINNSLSFYVICFDKKVPGMLKDIINSWKSVDQLSRLSALNEKREVDIHYGGLISQMLHDTQTLIHLSQSKDEVDLYKNKVNYMERVANELLFYIREIELLPENLPLKDLLESSIDLLNVDSKRFDIKLDQKVSSIYVDAELFSRAVNAILTNSLQAANRGDVIRIHVSLVDSGSPFIPYNWILIEIKDTSPGILEDYLPLIKTPFFSTRRKHGAAGFGLTNAEKIMQAHGGFLKIHSSVKKGTRTLLYFPEKMST